MKVNPISFKGVYHCSINAKEDFKKFTKIAIARQEEDKLGVKILFNHQNYDSIAHSLREFQDRSEDTPSINWLISHSKYTGIELPKYLNTGLYDVFVLTDKDKKDYEKTVGKRAGFLRAKHTIEKVAKEVEKDSPSDISRVDIFLKIIKAFNEIEQKEFNEFLKKRSITPMTIEEDEDENIYFLEDSES